MVQRYSCPIIDLDGPLEIQQVATYRLSRPQKKFDTVIIPKDKNHDNHRSDDDDNDNNNNNEDEVTKELRKPHNEELNDLYCLPNIVRVIKSRIMTWAGQVARMGERRGLYGVLVGET